jgi:hypothetical protein
MEDTYTSREIQGSFSRLLYLTRQGYQKARELALIAVLSNFAGGGGGISEL